MTILMPDNCRQIALSFLPADSECAVGRLLSGGFSGDLVLTIDSGEHRYVLRRSPERSVDERLLREQHCWLARLKREHFPVAVPLQNRFSGTTLLAQAGGVWQMAPWLPGEAVTGNSISSGQLQQAMQTLARIHCRSMEWSGQATGSPRSVSVRREIIRCWQGNRFHQSAHSLQSVTGALRDVLDSFAAGFLVLAGQIDQELKELEQVSVPLHWCFRDLWNAHVLFTGNQVTGWIDPHAARVDHLSTDLSRFLGSLFGDNPARWNEALQHYEGVRPLQPEERLLLRAMDRSSVLLSGMTWVERAARHEIRQEQVDQILNRLAFFDQRLQHLIATATSGHYRPGGLGRS